LNDYSLANILHDEEIVCYAVFPTRSSCSCFIHMIGWFFCMQGPDSVSFSFSALWISHQDCAVPNRGRLQGLSAAADCMLWRVDWSN